MLAQRPEISVHAEAEQDQIDERGRIGRWYTGSGYGSYVSRIDGDSRFRISVSVGGALGAL